MMPNRYDLCGYFSSRFIGISKPIADMISTFSKNDPLLNVNNPNSPVNNPVEPDEPTHDVNGPASASIFALTLFAVLLRLRRRS